MKKLITTTLALLLCLGLAAGCATPGANPTATPAGTAAAPTGDGGEAQNSTQLNLYTWEGMFPQEVLKAFTQETGITVNYVNFDYNETMLSKLETANGGDYDLIIADDYIVETVIKQGLAQKLDGSKISNYLNINPFYQGQYFDPQDEYTVPYGAGVQTIVYDPVTYNKEIRGYADLWDAALADSLGIIGNHRVINGMALKVLGESYNTEDIDTIKAAGERLKELAPNIRLIQDDNLQDALISGEISAAVMYTSQVTSAKLANPDIKVVYPTEGIGFGIMPQFIPVNAPHADAAYKFIDFILRPEISAQCFEFLGYYCTNKAADALIADEYKDYLTLPAGFKSDNMEMIQNVSEAAEAAHTQVWTEFKTACGQ